MSRILHVEDDPSIARAVKSMLRRDGHEVVSVSSAEQAIVELHDLPFDLVLSDFNLAGAGTGAEVLAASGCTPFVFLTSDDRADSYGVPRLEKPCPMSAVREAIDSLLRRAA